MKLAENDLEIDFTNVATALKFDQKDAALADFHDINAMPRVDFIVEFNNEIYFVEIKDPGQPNPADVGNTKLLKKIANGTLEASLIEKYLYSFFYRWAEDKLQKSVHYLCLITLESPMLPPITEGLEKQLKLLASTSSRWIRNPLASCQVHNIDTWNAVFPHWPVNRLSSFAPAGA